MIEEEKKTKNRKNKIKEADKIISEMNDISEEKIEVMRTKLEKCTSSVSDININGSHRLHAREEGLLLLAEMTSILDKGTEKLKDLYKKIPDEDRNLRIYFDKIYFKVGNQELIRKYDLTKQHINRIIKEIRKNL